MATVVLFVMWIWKPPQLDSLLASKVRSRRAWSYGGNMVPDLRTEKHPAAVLTVSLGALLGLAAAAPGTAALLLSGPSNPARIAVVSAIMAVCVLLAVLGGEVLLARNYGSSSAARRWPAQPVAPALLTAAIIALLLLAAAVVLTVSGEAALQAAGTPAPGGWIPTAASTAAVAVTTVPAILAVRRRRGIVTSDDGLDAALRAVALTRIVRILAAFVLAQAGGLLVSASLAFAALPGTAAPEEVWAGTAVGAGSALVVAAVVLSMIPVNAFAPRGKPAVLRAPVEPSR